MADVATIFHWSPETMDHMTLTELAMWREKARQRSGADDE